MIQNICDILDEQVKRCPNNEFLADDYICITFKQFHRLIQKFGRYMLENGVTKGATVGIFTDHSILQIICLFSISLINSPFVVLNDRIKGVQIAKQIKKGNIQYVLTTSKNLKNCRNFSKTLDSRILELPSVKVTLNSLKSTEEGADCDFVCDSILSDVSNIIFTSGSTGHSKGVLVPQRTLVEGASTVANYLELDKNDILLSFLPYHFDYGLNQILIALYVGCKVIVHRYKTPNEFFKIIKDYRVTCFATVPSLWP